MALVNDIQQITEWIQANICDGIELKKPTDTNRHNGNLYEFKLCHPKAIPFFIPARNMNDAGDNYVPCIIISMDGFKEDRIAKTRTMNVYLTFIVWNPGLQHDEIFVPNGDGTFSVQKSDRPAIEPDNQPGWQDLCNFVDIAKRKLIQNVYLTKELQITNDEIVFNMNNPKDLTGTDYPCFAGVLSFSLTGRFEQPANNFDNLL